MASSFNDILRRLAPPVKKGQKLKKVLTADRLNAIFEAIFGLARGDNIEKGANIRKKSGPGYVLLSGDLGGVTTGNVTVYDFTLTGSGGDNDETPSVTLGFGNVTGDGIGLKDGTNPYPEEFSAGNTPPWTDTKEVGADPWYAYLVVTVDPDPGGDGSQPPVIDSVSWDVGGALPADDPSGDTYYFLLGNGSKTPDGKRATVLNATGKGSQKFGYCAGAAYWSPMGPAAIP